MTGVAPPLTSFLEAHAREYRAQVQNFLVARLAIALVSLVVLLVYEEGRPRLFIGPYVALTVGLALSVVELIALRWTHDAERLALLAVVQDFALATLLAYMTGGIYNVGFAFLYFAVILAAAFLLSDRAGFVVASGATAALALIALAYWSAGYYPSTLPHLPGVHPQLHNPAVVELRWGRITANLIGVMLAFHGVALLASRLPYRSAARVLYDEILERMAEGVVAIDRRGRILLANAEARRLLNWTHAGVLTGRRYEDVLRRREDQQVLDVLAQGRDVDVELELTIRGRGQISVEARTKVLVDRRGRVRGVVGIFHDLSLRKRLDAMETRLARLADTEEMALGIAHEIRNPLGSIRGAVQELCAHALTDAGDKRLAEIVQRESSRLDRIIQQFLDFARMRPPVRQLLDLWTVVEETAVLLARRPDAKGVQIECPPAGPFLVEADPDQLRQAILNIGVNALDALAGKGRLRFGFTRTELPQRERLPGRELALVSAREGVELSIENDGPPIDEKAAARMFTPFFTTKRGGLGLGLAITQKILRQHGGDVSCDGGELGGARFRLLMPLADAAAPPRAGPAGADPTPLE